MSKHFRSSLFTSPTEGDGLPLGVKKTKTEQTMKCRVRFTDIVLHEKFPGINNEGQSLDANDPNYDDSDYSEILRGLRKLLKKEALKAAAEEREATEVLRLAVRLQVTNMGKKILPMICGTLMFYLECI
jgi:hypothetical protein